MFKETPTNIKELKKMANNKCSWRERLEAVNQLKEYDCQQSRDIVTRLTLYDPVETVRKAAQRAAQGFSITIRGKPIYLGKKPKGNLVKDITKKLSRVRNSLPAEFTLEDFKKKFFELYPEACDTYEGDKENRFDKWLSNKISSLPKKKQS